MAYITGEFENEYYEATIQVIKPEPIEEESFQEGMRLSIEVSGMNKYSLKDLRGLANWILETVAAVEMNYHKDGTKK